MRIYLDLVLPRVSAYCAPEWHRVGHYPYLPSGQSENPLHGAKAVCATLFGKQELTTCNAFSVLSGDRPLPPPVAPEPSPRGLRSHGTHTVQWPPASSRRWILRLFHPLHLLPTFLLWSLRLLYPLGSRLTMPIVFLILLVMPIILLFTLFIEPRVGKVCAKRLEEDSRSRRNWRHVYSLWTTAMA